MKLVKSVSFEIEPNQELYNLLHTFRDLANFCLEKGLEKKITSRFRLIKETYQEAKKFGLHTHYVLNACEVACSILKNYRRYKKAKKPEVKELFLKLDNQTYKLIEKDSLYLRIPFKPRNFLYIKLKYGEYQRRFLEDKTLKLGSVTALTSKIILCFEKKQEIAEPESKVALDINERNVTSMNGSKAKIYDLTKVLTTHYAYYLKRKRIQKKVKNRKLRKELLKKYSGNEKRKVEWLLHNVSKRIVEENPNSEIIMENLKNIRQSINRKKLKLNKYNNKMQLIRTKSKNLSRRLNSWNFGKLQKFIEYKTLWQDNLVSYVNPRGTSSTCPICGKRSDPNGRLFECECGFKLNRDLLACINILKMKGVWFSPDSLTMMSNNYEGERQVTEPRTSGSSHLKSHMVL
jgi:putative transposase